MGGLGKVECCCFRAGDFEDEHLGLGVVVCVGAGVGYVACAWDAERA